ncbi:hypothetical protein [Aestuariicoccus sp. MJ-SS9]|uniref:hypothetical protein n=1 Tax=Aestuariicoccus sp. MJ-SS9 TaxID=3079855 RepID=UPI0029105434|nr:hypothetical protein [Aestuariicoccus sp. MJ-SS9]MDU8913837.1 hypothetical protein [Aestuariicoccus sp. MJ-SS9]
MLLIDRSSPKRTQRRPRPGCSCLVYTFEWLPERSFLQVEILLANIADARFVLNATRQAYCNTHTGRIVTGTSVFSGDNVFDDLLGLTLRLSKSLHRRRSLLLEISQQASAFRFAQDAPWVLISGAAIISLAFSLFFREPVSDRKSSHSA